MSGNPLVTRGIVSGLVAALIAASTSSARAQDAPVESGLSSPDDAGGVPDLVPLIPLFQPVDAHSETSTCSKVTDCYALANQRFTEGNFREAAELFLQTYDLAGTIETRHEQLRNAAISYEHAGVPSNALRYYREYVKKTKGTGKRNIQITSRFPALSSYVEGIDLFERQDYDGALKALKMVEKELRSDNPPASLCGHIGRAYEALNKSAEALAQYNLCLERVRKQGKYPVLQRELEEKVAALASPEPAPSPAGYGLESLDLSAPDPAEGEIPSQGETSFFSRHSRSLLVMGASGIVGGAGLVLNYLGDTRFSELAESCGRTTEGCSESEISALNQYILGRNIGYTLAGIGVAAGIGLFIAESLNNPKPAEDKVSVNVHPAGVALALRY